MGVPISPYSLRHPAPACQPAEPLFAIGDVHGHARHLEVILGHAGTLLATGKVARVVFLGDLIDRGPDSASCLRLAAEFRDRHPESVDILAGNHESLMLSAYYHHDAEERAFAAYIWNHNGGDLARWSDTKDLLDELALGPDRWKSHLLNGNVLLVHAGVCPGATDDEVRAFLGQSVLQLPDGAGSSFPHWAWIRDGFLQQPTPWPGHFVVHGHSPWDFSRKPQAGRLNLDAGSYENGRIGTALLERGQVEVSIFGFWT